MFVRTTTVNKLLKMSGRIKVVQGGTSAGKTYGIIPVLIDYATKNPRKRITVVAETLPAVKDGALQIFKDVMYDTGRWVDDRFNRSALQYMFANGAVIQFKSFDSVGKAKSAGKRDVLFLNEANHIPYEIADTLMIRSKETWIDFNPDNKFWVHTDTLQHPEAEFLLLTYKDNEACPEETIRDLEYKKVLARTSEFWKNWCKVYIDGEIGKLQDTIFDNWEQVLERPERFTEYIYSLDFGYVHPTAMMRVWFHENEIFLEPIIYESGLTSSTLIDKMKSLDIEYFKDIVADPARPEMMTDIELEGFNILKANKSVQYGFDVVRSYKVYYSSEDIKNEYESYRHKKIKEEITDDPIKKNDDLMDAARYGIVFVHENYSRDTSYFSFK
jgi:phage terminase large subunit